MNSQIRSEKSHALHNIYSAFKNYRQQLHHIWEDVTFVDHYADAIHNQLLHGELDDLRILSLLAPQYHYPNAHRTMQILKRLRTTTNNRRAFIEATSTFEDFLSQLVFRVYRDYPGKLISRRSDDHPMQSSNLLDLVVKSKDKEEIISRIIEERIRSLFYGNPVDFFQKDKAKLEFGDYFRSNHQGALEDLQEVLARRNIIVHSGGRVDRKYLREVRNSSLQLGRKLNISMLYLRASLALFGGLGAATAGLIVQNIYKEQPLGRLVKLWQSLGRRQRIDPSL